jgi:hypothetical protein
MTLDWTAIRLELLQIDAPKRSTLREMRRFFRKIPSGILARRRDAGGGSLAAAALGLDRRGRFRRPLCKLGGANLRVSPARRRRAAMVCRLPPDVRRRKTDAGGRGRGFRASAAPPRPPRAREHLCGSRRDNSTGLRVSHSTNEEAGCLPRLSMCRIREVCV